MVTTKTAPRSARRRRTSARRASTLFALVLGALVGMLSSRVTFVAAQGALESDVVLVFDVSGSILDSTDGTNVEFAAALERVADRVEEIADDLAAGNAEISFVAFARTATQYPDGCQRLALHNDPAAVVRFGQCLRSVASEYRAGAKAPVRQRINVQGTDYVAALREAARLLPSGSSRSGVIFFTDGEHNPPGTSRDNEDVVAAVTPAFEGKSPLAILPVGLGTGAGAFESRLAAIYNAFFRGMEPCEGRASFSWPEVVFPSGDEAGSAVALALQEVTCSFTVAPTPTPIPTPTPPPPGAPVGVQILGGNQSLTIQWLPPSSDSGPITDYLVHCRPTAGGDWIESGEGVSTDTETVIDGLEPGVAYDCEVAATDGITVGPYSPAAAPGIVLGIPVAPGQPRAEPLDAAARLTVEAVTGGAPVEQYVYECTNAAGQKVVGAGSQPSVVVTGLVNGDSVQCVGYTENRIGRSPASPASASFSPCAGLFECVPWAKWAISGGVLAALLAIAFLVTRRYQRRNRVWVTAQVDGGENRPLGWGPKLGVRLDQDEAGWFAAPRPIEGADIQVTYQGRNRFFVESPYGVRDVHQGDVAPVREATGDRHLLILRRYTEPPPVAAPAPRPVEHVSESPLDARLAGEESREEPPEIPGGLIS